MGELGWRECVRDGCDRGWKGEGGGNAEGRVIGGCGLVGRGLFFDSVDGCGFVSWC